MPTYASFAPTTGAVPVSSSSLLAITPPAITKVLSQSYPFVSAADRFLGLVTWTDDDPYKSFLMVVGWCALVRYFNIYIHYFGHLGAAVICALIVSGRNRKVDEHPSLDIITQRMANLNRRFNILLEPLTLLKLTKTDITRFLFAAVFMTPLYVVVAYYLTGRTLLTVSGVIVLTWHSLWARVTRSILWRWKLVRIIVFYTTGIDFSRAWGAPSQTTSAPVAPNSTNTGSGDVKFTYVLYENQRCWLGIGWTSNMLSYERTPWTDEFLNESVSPEVFSLPDSEGTGMQWHWVDKSWRVDLSNDGALAPRSKVRFTPDPGESDGYVYYDNMWKAPSAEPTYSKYTRRRRWVRTAELVSDANSDKDHEADYTEPFDASGHNDLQEQTDANISVHSETHATPMGHEADTAEGEAMNAAELASATAEAESILEALELTSNEGSTSVQAQEHGDLRKRNI